MKIARLAAATALATLVAASGASAATSSLKFDGWTNGNVGVNVTAPGYNGSAGAFNMKDTSTLDNFAVFCLDILGVIYSSKTYDYESTDTPFSNSVDLIANGGVDRIQKIFDSGYDDALSSSVKSAGFQVALWNAVYDDDWSVANGAGTFYETASNGGVRAQANAFLLDAQFYAGDKNWDLTYLQGLNTNSNLRRSQNLVTASPVPLPAAGLMLLFSLAGLGVAGRRRKTVS